MAGPRPCRECGMTIEFAKGANGRPIPLQRVRSTYWIDSDGIAQRVASEGGGAVFVSHWETCYRAAAIKARQTKGAG